MLDQEGWNKRMVKQEFINVGALSYDTSFNTPVRPQKIRQTHCQVGLRRLEKVMADAK